MMVKAGGLLVCAWMLMVCLAAGQRLIQFSETNKVWLSQSEVDKLVFTPEIHNFMDVTETDALYSELSPQKAATPIPKTPVHQEYVKTLLPQAVADNIVASITTLSEFHTRYYTSTTGVQAAHFVQHNFMALAEGKPQINVKNFTNTFPQPSVIATIPGTGPNAASIVIIGAHLDSVGTSSTARSPGADDDGSGTSTLFEIFRVLVDNDYQPDYTLQFMAYAAEEAGLLGSQAIAQSYLKAGIDVYAMLQLDMTGYDKGSIGIITDYTSGELNTFVRTLVQTYTSLSWKNSVCGYGCSDHASWNKTGVRASFPFETPFGSHNPNIHSSRDVVDHLSPAQMLQFAYLGIGFAVELAGVGSAN